MNSIFKEAPYLKWWLMQQCTYKLSEQKMRGTEWAEVFGNYQFHMRRALQLETLMAPFPMRMSSFYDIEMENAFKEIINGPDSA